VLAPDVSSQHSSDDSKCVVDILLAEQAVGQVLNLRVLVYAELDSIVLSKNRSDSNKGTSA
jgi:hypothetical protein